MKKQHFRAYGVDLDYEYKTYKNVGKDYGNSKTADKGCIANFTRFYRKKFNKNQKNYATCNTYTEWKKHVKCVTTEGIANYEDFLHWLNYKKSCSEERVETAKVILIPVYIVLISLSMQIYYSDSITIWHAMISIAIIVVMAAIILLNALEKVRFYEDIIQICEAEFRENSKKE